MLNLEDALLEEEELEANSELKRERAKTAELLAQVQSLEQKTREVATLRQQMARLQTDNETLRARSDLDAAAAKASSFSLFPQSSAQQGSSSSSSTWSSPKHESCPSSLLRAALKAKSSVGEPSVGTDTSSTAPGDGEEDARSSGVNSRWNVLQWAGSLHELPELLTGTLLAPFSSRGGADGKPSSAAQLAFVHALGGDEVTETDLLHLLERSPLLHQFARLIKEEAHKLTYQKAATAYELNEKFAGDDKSFILSFGGLSTFLEGLSGLIGPPEPNLHAAMSREHCMCDDSTVPFEGERRSQAPSFQISRALLAVISHAHSAPTHSFPFLSVSSIPSLSLIRCGCACVILPAS